MERLGYVYLPYYTVQAVIQRLTLLLLGLPCDGNASGVELQRILLPSNILHCMFIFSTPVFSQYDVNTGLRPDMTFGDHNDRFDMSSLIDYQNKYFRSDGSVDYRRKHDFKKKFKPQDTNKNLQDAALRSRKARKKLAKKLRRETEAQINSLANSILLRMASTRRSGEQDKFLLRDVDDKEDHGDDKDLNDILARVPTRRSGQNVAGYRKVGTDPDMFNYAFPIDMRVKGYLVAPESL